MREKRVVELKAEVEKLENRLDEFLKKLGGFEDQQNRAFNVSANIPSTDSNISDLRARHAVVAGLVKKLDKKGGGIVPASFFNAAMNALRSISNAADQIDAEIQQINGWQGLQSIDYDRFLATSVSGNQSDLSGAFKTLYDASEAYLSAFHSLFQSINPSKASFNFSSAAEALSKIISRASETRNELRSALLEAQAALKDIKAQQETLSATAEQANTHASSISELLESSSVSVNQIDAYRDRALETSNEAKALEITINEYEDKFEKFDEALEARNIEMGSGSDFLSDLTSELTDQKEQIRTLIAQSDSMLSGATVAGLSSEFKTIRDDLTIQLKSASTAFYWSIGLLFASALPLIIFIFAPVLAPYLLSDTDLVSAIAAAGTEKSGWQYVGQVIARFIILLPGIWLVTFAMGRYNSLFRLREHYSYKYSMAFAVDGFKKQAPGHEDMIAALVFEQLAFNPADKLGKQQDIPDETPNPVSNLFLNFLRKRTDEK